MPDPPSTSRVAPSCLRLATYLLSASQGEEQVQRCLGEMQVLLHAKAHLQRGEEGRQDGEPAGHLQPRVTILIHLAQLLCQVKAQDTHLLGPEAKMDRREERGRPALHWLPEISLGHTHGQVSGTETGRKTLPSCSALAPTSWGSTTPPTLRSHPHTDRAASDSSPRHHPNCHRATSVPLPVPHLVMPLSSAMAWSRRPPTSAPLQSPPEWCFLIPSGFSPIESISVAFQTFVTTTHSKKYFTLCPSIYIYFH